VAGLDERHVAKAKRLVSEKATQSKGTLKGEQSVKTRYVLTFEKDVVLPGGSELKRLVRVTMDDTGEVIRLTSSK
jgi:hypothetical protein